MSKTMSKVYTFGLVIYADNRPPVVVALPTGGGMLDEAKKYVDVHFTPVPLLSRRRAEPVMFTHMLVDEDAKLKGSPVNHAATCLTQLFAEDGFYGWNGPILGDVVLLRRPLS